MRRAILCLAVAAPLIALPSAAPAASFSNPAPIANSPVPGSGPALPYPSTISVSGQAGTVSKARVVLSGVVAAAGDLDVLLVGPSGSTILMSDTCGAAAVDLANVTLTFDDDAAASLPVACPPGPPTGTYKPSNNDTADAFPLVPPPYPLGLANFRGVSPNGSWSLHVFDDTAPDAVSIGGGWALELTTTGAAKKKCKKSKKPRASAKKKKRCKKKKKKKRGR